MKEVVIIDSGANLASLRYAFRRAGARAHVSADPAVIAAAPRVLLPGVGAAAQAMRQLAVRGLLGTVRALTQPVLGVCLGMQLLFEHSEEGVTACLGIIPDRVRRLSAAPGLPVPHMGWNALQAIRPDPLLEGVAEGEYAYFVHSYGAPVAGHTLARAEYGTPLAAVIRWRNFWGTQFHPERSAATGARILRNFLEL